MEILKDQIIDIINQCFNKNVFNRSMCKESFENCNIDSIMFIRIIVAIEETFDVTIPDEYLYGSKLNTVETIANIVYCIQH